MLVKKVDRRTANSVAATSINPVGPASRPCRLDRNGIVDSDSRLDFSAIHSPYPPIPSRGEFSDRETANRHAGRYLPVRLKAMR
jgi:hypothetical protein